MTDHRYPDLMRRTAVVPLLAVFVALAVAGCTAMSLEPTSPEPTSTELPGF